MEVSSWIALDPIFYFKYSFASKDSITFQSCWKRVSIQNYCFHRYELFNFAPRGKKPQLSFVPLDLDYFQAKKMLGKLILFSLWKLLAYNGWNFRSLRFAGALNLDLNTFSTPMEVVENFMYLFHILSENCILFELLTNFIIWPEFSVTNIWFGFRTSENISKRKTPFFSKTDADPTLN